MRSCFRSSSRAGERKKKSEMARVTTGGLVVLLATVLITLAIGSSSIELNDFEKCENIVLNWANSSSAIDYGIEEKKSILQDLLFFLHVPRTGGKSYYHCFLRQLYPRGAQCPLSYNNLKFDSSKPNCRMIALHNDYSLMAKLPKQRTSVVTILRHPLDRVISIYEFSIKIAARHRDNPDITSATQMVEKLCSGSPGDCGLKSWPWKHLVPRMTLDLIARRESRGNRRMMSEGNGIYNMSEIVMPLHDFINDPLAHEIIHNAATLQVAGLAENSCLEESHAVRRCIRMHPSLGCYVLDVAKKRLDNMFHVGLTEKHKESAIMLAHTMGETAISELQELEASQPNKATNNDAEKTSSLTDSEIEELVLQMNHVDGSIPDRIVYGNAKMLRRNMTLENLMEAYDQCTSRLRKFRRFRYAQYLNNLDFANFSKQARRHVPESVIQQILSFNNLDIELHKHAQDIFEHRQKYFMPKLSRKESQEDNSVYSWLPKMVILTAIVLLFLIPALFLLNA